MKNIILGMLTVEDVTTIAWMTMILLIIVIPFAIMMLKKWFKNNN